MAPSLLTGFHIQVFGETIVGASLRCSDDAAMVGDRLAVIDLKEVGAWRLMGSAEDCELVVPEDRQIGEAQKPLGGQRDELLAGHDRVDD